MYLHRIPVAGIGPIGTPELILLAPLFAIFAVMPFWFICKKAGLSPWLALVMFIPIGWLVLPLVLAFIGWPSLERNKTYGSRIGS